MMRSAQGLWLVAEYCQQHLLLLTDYTLADNILELASCLGGRLVAVPESLESVTAGVSMAVSLFKTLSCSWPQIVHPCIGTMHCPTTRQWPNYCKPSSGTLSGCCRVSISLAPIGRSEQLGKQL